MPESVLVIGHRNPDADAICSAIAYARYKNEHPARSRELTYEAARCGNSNARIDAILKRFQVPLPSFVGDVTPRLSDVMTRDLVTVGAGATCAEILELIHRHDIQAVPVVDDKGVLQGVVSIYQLGRFFTPRLDRPEEMRRVRTSIRHVARTVGGEMLHGREVDEPVDLLVRVGAMELEAFAAAFQEERFAPHRTAIVVGDRRRIQEAAIRFGVRLLVVTGGLAVDPGVVEMAREHGVSLLVSPHDTATTAWAFRTAALVDPLVSTDEVLFRPTELLRDARRKTAGMAPAVFLVAEEGRRLVGVFSRRDLMGPPARKLVLVDHNELSQAVQGADEVEIVEVVDHHRLGDLRTPEPILFLNRPVGSTCTIIADLFRQDGRQPDAALAGVLMGGLVSDTLNLRSPTTTPEDVRILEWLEGVSGVTGTELANDIFQSGSVVQSMSAADLLEMDMKLYQEGEDRFSISQLEEVGFVGFHERTPELLAGLAALRERKGLRFSALLATDVKEQDSLLFFAGDPMVARSISYPVLEEGRLFQLPGVVSRKKQLLPFLTRTLVQE